MSLKEITRTERDLYSLQRKTIYLFAPALSICILFPSFDISKVCVKSSRHSGEGVRARSVPADAPLSCLADADEDLTSLERCLADPLVLVAQQQVGGDKLWLLPQTRWQEGETLRQTAERALASLPGNDDFFFFRRLIKGLNDAADVCCLIFPPLFLNPHLAKYLSAFPHSLNH